MSTARLTRFVQDHDPQDTLDYTWRFRLESGETIVSVAIVVNDDNGALATGANLVLTNTSFGLMPGEITWGVTTWVSGGTAGVTYNLCCTVTTSSSPTPRVISRTVLLHCVQQ